MEEITKPYIPKLYIFVEGQWDKLFFDKKLHWKIREMGRYSDVIIRQYANTPNETISKYVRSFIQNNDTCWFVGDIDKVNPASDNPIADASTELQQKYSLSPEISIIIIVKNIEHWYCAGINDEAAEALEIWQWSQDGKCNKMQFESKRPKKFSNETDFRSEMLKKFDYEVAQRNTSFADFMSEYIHA